MSGFLYAADQSALSIIDGKPDYAVAAVPVEKYLSFMAYSIQTQS